MGMAATQARLISLKARMSNVEYQGQQINQERTILSQQATDLYTSLLAMTVPTPPSTQDYATITYKGVDGNTTFSIGNVKPSGQKYVVEIQQTATGDAIVSDYGSVAVKNAPDIVKGKKLETVPKNELTQADLQNYYVKKSDGTVIQLDLNKTDYVEISSETQDAKTGVINKKYKIKSAAISDTTSLYIADSSDSAVEIGPNPSATTSPFIIGGKQAYSYDKAQLLFPDMFDWDRYEEAIVNTYGTNQGATTKDDFYVYVERSNTGVYSLKFALKADVESPDGFASTFSYTANGKYTTSTETDQCELEFDTQGRIKRIGIPSFDKTTGEIISYKYIDLTAETSYDEAAYQDAYAQYEYKMYEYDKKNQEINAKTEVIQQEDKNLELKLTRLDNERDALKNEIDACDKVVKDNIEKSFKTFSG